MHSDVGRGGGSERVHHHRRRHGFRPPTSRTCQTIPTITRLVMGSHKALAFRVYELVHVFGAICNNCARWQLRTTQAILGHTAQSLGQLARAMESNVLPAVVAPMRVGVFHSRSSSLSEGALMA